MWLQMLLLKRILNYNGFPFSKCKIRTNNKTWYKLETGTQRIGVWKEGRKILGLIHDTLFTSIIPFETVLCVFNTILYCNSVFSNSYSNTNVEPRSFLVTAFLLVERCTSEMYQQPWALGCGPVSIALPILPDYYSRSLSKINFRLFCFCCKTALLLISDFKMMR